MRQALEMALEALEWFTAAEQGIEPPINKTITAIKEALAQPEQEPDVSHKLKFDCEFVDGTCADLTVYGSERDIKRLEARIKFWWNLEQHSGTPDSDKAERIRLGKPPQPEQEPVAWRHDMGEENGGWEYFEEASCPDCQPLYTTPPQRTWVGLTDEERKDIELGIEVFAMSVEDILKETEAKLKEKNT